MIDKLIIEKLINEKMIYRKIPAPNELSGAIKSAERFIERARGNMGIKYYDIAFILAYTSMFQSSKALLIKNGCGESSHYGLFHALKEIYKNNPSMCKLLNIADSYRPVRHAIQYGRDSCSEDDAREAIADAEEMLAIAKKLLLD
jgi:uncharacterized protein (UPF0332 family)